MQRLILFMGVILMPIFILSGQTISGRVSSSVYTFERFDISKSSETYIRGYQQLQLNMGYGIYSVRSSFNYENSFGNTLAADPRMRVYQLYFQAEKLFDFLMVRVGRQPIFNGLASGVYDGAALKANYKMVTLNVAYGGILPAYQKLDFKDFANNNVAAVDLSAFILDAFTVSAGYSRKNYKAEDYWALRLDDKFNPLMMLIRKNSRQFEFANCAVSYFPEDCRSNASLRYEYDVNARTTSKIEGEGEISLSPKFDISAYGNYRTPRVRYNTIFSVFDFGNMIEGEAGLTYHINPSHLLSARFGVTNYNDDNSSRVNLGYTYKYGTVNYRKTFGYAGELDAVTLQAAHTCMNGKFTPSLALSYTNYKLSPDDPANSLFTVIGGVNYRPFRTFSVDAQGQFLNNKIYQNDFRFLIKLNYWFHKVW